MSQEDDQKDVTVSRKDAIASLIDVYQTKYTDGNEQQHKQPQSSFYVNPNVTFAATDCSNSSRGSSISVCAAENIPKGSVLLMVPHAERISLSHAPSVLRPLLQAITKSFDTKKHTPIEGVGTLSQMYTAGDITLPLVILQGIKQQQQQGGGSNVAHVAQTWPSPRDLQEQYDPLWKEEHPWSTKRHDLLRGTYTLEMLQRYARGLRYAFDEIVLQILDEDKKIMPNEAGPMLTDFLPSVFDDTPPSSSSLQPKEKLWIAFWYAHSLVRSRAHQGRSNDEPEIIPLVDLINGLPSYCKDRINVDITKSKIGSTSCSVVVASKDIAKEQELILSYGDLQPSHFITRYACLPDEIFQYSQAALDMVQLQVPSFLAPADSLRTEACRQAGFPHTSELIERDFVVPLPCSDLEAYQTTPAFRGETHHLSALRQFLIVCHLLDDDTVRANIATGRLRSNNISQFQVAQLHLMVIDYTLRTATSLDETDNQKDLEEAAKAIKANDYILAAVYHARVCQRDTMAQWRHAICCKYSFVSQPVEPSRTWLNFQTMLEHEKQIVNIDGNSGIHSAPLCLLSGRGCHVCGKSIHLKNCSQCKVIKYCSRDHQRIDWKKGHKKHCDPSLASS